MKSTIKFLILALAVVLYSCDIEENPIYDGTSSDVQTLVKFQRSAYGFNIPIGDETTLSVTVEASTIKDFDRTFNVTVIEDETTAAANTYSVPNTVTIPANSYTGTLPVYGVDTGLPIGPVQLLTIELSDPNAGSSNTILENQKAVLSQTIVCPVRDDFLVGDYEIEDVIATVGPQFLGTPSIVTEVVDVQIGSIPTERVMNVNVLPSFGVNIDITLSLNCNLFFVNNNNPIPLGIYCDDPEVGLAFGAVESAFASEYDQDNEQDYYVITYNEDFFNDCDVSGVSSFSLTKN